MKNSSADTCAVSVIIPVYNAEKFLSVCLESLLIQTLQDFEVIVVDDCSTDASPVIVENYLERFGGRLKMAELSENSGGGGLPRNVGLEIAQGKYIFFADSDDLFVDTALETLYNFAEKYRAEVVYMEKFFTCGEELVPEDLELAAWCNNDSFVEEPTLESNNIVERLDKFLSAKFCWSPWAKFMRRDFLLANEITFPQMAVAEDVIHTFKLICLAERWLRVPEPLYINRANSESLMRREHTSEQLIIARTSPLITGLDVLEEFMRGLDFFRQNPVVRLQVLNFFALLQIDNMEEAFKKLEPTDAYEILLRGFAETGSSQPALVAYLLLMNNLYRNELKSLT